MQIAENAITQLNISACHRRRATITNRPRLPRIAGGGGGDAAWSAQCSMLVVRLSILFKRIHVCSAEAGQENGEAILSLFSSNI